MSSILSTINETANAIEEEAVIESLLESTLDVAIESVAKRRIIDEKSRDSLPDSAFGIIYLTKDGEKIRKYPILIKNDYESTKELLHRAIQYFNYCRSDWKEQLAHNILRVMVDEDIQIKISPKSSIHEYVKFPEKFIAADTNNEYQHNREYRTDKYITKYGE